MLIVCTERYCQKVNDRTKPSYGRGVKWESTLLYQHLYDDDSFNHRFIPLLFDGADEPHIPTPIKGSTYYLPLTEDGYLKLYRRLTEHPHLATSLNNLANLYRQQGKLTDAEPQYQRAI